MNKFNLFLLSVLCVSNVCAYNILVVFPYASRSHMILGEGFVRHLLKAGHEVTYITTSSIKPQPKLKIVDVSSNMNIFDIESVLDFKKLLKEGTLLHDLMEIYGMTMYFANMTITHENVQKFMLESNETYDVAITEWLYTEQYCGFASVFNVPYIWSSSMEPHSAVLSLIDEPYNPSYVPDHLSPISPPLSFTERVKELWGLAYVNFVRWILRDADEKTFKDGYGPAATKRGVKLPTLQEMKYKSALMFGNSHVSSGESQRLPQNYIPIAGYHIDDEVAPLPENLKKILDNAPHGVIYFSMGTMMKSKTMPEDFKRAFLKVFSELKQTVIWKFEEDLPDLPKNVHIVQWAPQQSILAHPNCIVFVTHGGLLSTTEALHFGVPIIGMPLFADQHINVARAVRKGFALQVVVNYDAPTNLKAAIEEILSNKKYKEKVKELSFIYHHRPIKPGAEIVHWVEHVIKTKGAPHLQSPALHIPLYQKLYLDVLAAVVVILLVLLRVVKKLLGRFKNNDDLKKNN
ncbi:UDP-glycosyltransferase UGT5-like [Anticarsia gemmatalis]|uniref:UDP-glycosyltransferase UGT5-like n=1 Tax=Anticarsia gemmatalis TaxID=129554 RepID=UPI003F759F6F